MKKVVVVFLGILLMASPALANRGNYQPSNTVNSELGHVAGGIVIGGAVTALVDKYWPAKRDKRGWLGFGIGAAAGFLGEGIQYLDVDYFSWLDAGSCAVGAAIGAFVTDKFILSPIVKTEKGDKVSKVGLVARFEF
ncbi:MAG: hypothetical protein V1793_22540 [Pseudomonadota bacterium]